MDYHFDPQQALAELSEEALLPNPVFVRDMILRAQLTPELALELNREFQSYLAQFGETEKLAQRLLERLLKLRDKVRA